MENRGKRDIKDGLTTLALSLCLVYTPNFSPAYDLCTFCSLLVEYTFRVIFEELALSHHLDILFNGISFGGGEGEGSTP